MRDFAEEFYTLGEKYNSPSKQEISEADDIFAKIKAEDPGHRLVEFGQVVLGVMHRRKNVF